MYTVYTACYRIPLCYIDLEKGSFMSAFVFTAHKLARQNLWHPCISVAMVHQASRANTVVDVVKHELRFRKVEHVKKEVNDRLNI